MGESAEELRRDIERTRDRMGYTLDAIGDRVSPGRMMERRRNRMVNRFYAARDAVMGSASDTFDSLSGTAHNVADSVGEHGSNMADTMSQAPQMARRQTRGNPFAAGLIAFGAGLLAATVIPASDAERRAADRLKDAAQPLAEPLQERAKDVGHELASTVQETGQEAMDSVKQEASSAADSVKETASSHAQETKDAGQSAAQEVRSS